LTDRVRAVAEEKGEYVTARELPKAEVARLIKELEKSMKEAATNLEFEKARSSNCAHSSKRATRACRSGNGYGRPDSCRLSAISFQR
jgi:excinuclease UvrABC helicase subunit UvrB